MTAWLYLTGAILAEVAATLSLKASDNFTRLWPSVTVVAGYGLAFWFLSRALSGIGIGTAYAVWAGLGTIGAAVGGYLLYSEQISRLTLAGIALVVVGVVLINLGVGQNG